MPNQGSLSITTLLHISMPARDAAKGPMEFLTDSWPSRLSRTPDVGKRPDEGFREYKPQNAAGIPASNPFNFHRSLLLK